MTAPPPHKELYLNFIEPHYPRVEQVNPGKVSEEFQTFLDTCLQHIPDDGSPADLYMYRTHMGEFLRQLDAAKDSFVKAQLAFYAKRSSGV